MSNAVEYQVDEQGSVVKVKSLDGDEYKITQSINSKKPLWAKGRRRSRWEAFKQLVANQPHGKWVTYGPFEDEKEVLRAQNVLYRYDKDPILKDAVGGKGLTTSRNIKTREVAVLIGEEG